MVKSFRYFKKPPPGAGNNPDDGDDGPKRLYKYSVYMQSRDSTWLNRNLNNANDEDREPIEEDIRD